MGHDPDIRLPHVPGHELAGTVVATGKGVMRFKVGDRVTVPFVSGCGHCGECHSGNQQVCPNQFQPGFTHWGSFAEYVAIDYADTNLVHLPDSIDDATAASLGCRFATSFRAVVDQGANAARRMGRGAWLRRRRPVGDHDRHARSAPMPSPSTFPTRSLPLPARCGAVATINAAGVADVAEAVREITKGGAHVSIDALGHPVTCFNSIKNLRRRGRHVQVGLMLGEHATPQIPMAQVIGHELEIYGSHGMQAWRYDAMLAMLAAGKIAPQKLIGRQDQPGRGRAGADGDGQGGGHGDQRDYAILGNLFHPEEAGPFAARGRELHLWRSRLRSGQTRRTQFDKVRTSGWNMQSDEEDMIMAWSAGQYVKFEDERTRPARDLLAQVPLERIERAIDLGCGPGNSTELIVERYGAAGVSGLDSDENMLEAARKRMPGTEFVKADLATWQPENPSTCFSPTPSSNGCLIISTFSSG